MFETISYINDRVASLDMITAEISEEMLYTQIKEINTLYSL